LTHFRNLVSTSLDVPAEGAILVGNNGQGKTSFLEAIHFLSRFRSFRGARRTDAIAFGADHFRVEGGFRYSNGRSRTVAVAVDRGTRRIAVDGQDVARPVEAVGTVLTVLLVPEDLDLIDGGPASRRRYLDTILGLTSAVYRNALIEYERILRQRNELLRSGGRDSERLLGSWSEAMVNTGAGLVTARSALVRRVTDRFGDVGVAVAGEGERTDFRLEYRPGIPLAKGPVEDEDEVADVWSAALRDRLEQDRRRGWTTVGPHCDEVIVRLANRPLARFGSQGERRTAAVALRILEAEMLEAETGHLPLLLLDDVFSEFDEGRARRLLDGLGDRHQRFITTPRPLPWLDGSLSQWQVDGGSVGPERVAA
jgi:DNA replication and repair protein RecF